MLRSLIFTLWELILAGGATVILIFILGVIGIMVKSFVKVWKEPKKQLKLEKEK